MQKHNTIYTNTQSIKYYTNAAWCWVQTSGTKIPSHFNIYLHRIMKNLFYLIFLFLSDIFVKKIKEQQLNITYGIFSWQHNKKAIFTVGVINIL